MNGLFCRMLGGGRRNNPGPSDYHIKSKIGDAPKYTIKQRYKSVERPNTAPYRNLPSTVGEGPKASLHIRPKDADGYSTPGPNYVPPKLGEGARKNAMSFRTAAAKDPRIDNPGPGAYNYTPRFANDANKYTLHQRTAMSARDFSPGPAAYTPDYKKVKKSAPQATMHVRPKDRAIAVTPGPSDYAVSRDLGGQKSTMHVRPNIENVNSNPGPGQYSPTNANKPKEPSFTMKGRHEIPTQPNTAPYRELPSTVGEGPKISLSSRHKERDPVSTPGPNYIPPNLGSDAQKSTLSGRTGEEYDPRRDNPGPGAYEYTPKFGNDAQKSTLHQRTGTEIRDISPGPAAYSPQLPASGAGATMHVRPKDRDIEVTPGPSDYEVSRDLGGQKSTMHVRPNIENVNSNPGPGQYSPTNANKPKEPSFTMKGRHEIPTQPNTAPYRELPSTVGEGPKISLSSRHKERDPVSTPGPNYIPPNLGSDAQKSTLSGRTGEEYDPRRDNPGPGAYEYTPKFGNDAQKSTFHQRTGTEVPDISPGPAAYSPQLPASGAGATMHVRPKDRDIEVTPGPSDYEVSRDLGGQKSTMHIRPQDQAGYNNPGPGQYTPTDANKPSNPRFTMKGRHEIPTQPNTAPYRELPSTVGEGPKISLSSRHKERDPVSTPGPNYIPPNLGSDAQKSTLSGRTGEEYDPRRDNPGPGAYEYTPKFGNDAQKSTLHQRTGTEVPDISPGPAAYTPQLPASGKVPTMHVRPKDRDIEVTPGPSDYEVSRDLGGQKSTMHVRPNIENVNSNPGPGQYSPTNANKPKEPSFTMKGRHEIPTQPNTAPYRELPSTVGEGPKISLSSRHKERDPVSTPGPNYIPPNLGSDAQKSTLSGRTGEEYDPRRDNPGPGAYEYTPKFGNDAQKSTFHQRTGTEVPDISPGPAAYTPQLPASGKVPTMHVRPKDRDIEVTPGPSDYEVSRDLGGQKSTMHVRPNIENVNSNPGPGQYSPTNANKPKEPSFTMKGRHEIPTQPNTAPYRELPSTVGEGPKISLSSRHKERDPVSTPGPNYIPPNLGSDAQKSTLSGRTGEEYDPRRDNPGPGAYEYTPKFGNDAQKSTLHQRTGTEIRDISPGPAAYSPQLPASGAGATMHVRPKDRDIEVTPGPSDYEVSRDLGGQKSTMHIRPQDQAGYNNPGPGQYTPTDANKPSNPRFTMKGRHEIPTQPNTAPYRELPSTVGEGPKISLSSRHKERDPVSTPGPNYIPPNLGSDAQKSTLSGRTGEEYDPRRDNPGPGAYEYTPKFGNDAQKSTLHQRTGTEVPDISPGPAAYTPQLPASGKVPTMHVRPKDRDIEVTPGPSDYEVSRDLGGQKSTMHVRPNIENVNSNPGPGQYSPTNANKPKEPSFTMKGRHEIPTQPNTAPYRELPSTVGEGPKISLSSRHKERDPVSTPGPNYIPPNLGSDAQKSTLSGRTGEEYDPRRDNPGPGAYEYTPKFGNDAQKSTFHQRTGTEVPDISPGPAAYSPQLPASGAGATMHVRPKDRDIEVTPGPSDYEVSRDLGGQKSTMHIRPQDQAGYNNPGPGQYTPTDANKPSNPRFTMKGRHEIPTQPNTAPYRELPSTVGEGPKISLSSRHKERDPVSTPGPNYIPPNLGSDAQKSTLSGRTGEEYDPRRDNPGPGAYEYTPKFGNDAQKSTLHQRTGTEVPDISPGPAAYSPQLPASGAGATMHVRPKDRDIEVTPGPSDYEVSRDLGGQKSTMHVRPNIENVNSNPGPGQYSPTNANKPKEPSFTMKGRHEIPTQPNTAPYRELPSTVGEGPKISLSSRHKERDPVSTPGPNYIPPNLGSDAQKSTLSGRTGEEYDPRRDNPGPGAYEYTPKFGNDAQKSTLHQRTGTEVPDISPGPAAYTPQLPASGAGATMHFRPKDKGPEETPGYVKLPSTLGGPKYTIGNREDLDMEPV